MLAALSLLALLSLPQATDTTLPPSTTQIALTAEGRGVQIYRCQQQAGGYAWTFVAPEADLADASTHQPVATHGAGPTWTSIDGSSITGKVLEKSSPDPASIPWLLLSSTPAGNPGAFAHIAYVRRSQTHGGNAPANGCDAGHANQTTRVPYTATYTFYTGQ